MISYESHHCLEYTKDGIYCRGVGGIGQADRIFFGGGSAVVTYSKGRLTVTQFENPCSSHITGGPHRQTPDI